MKKARVLSILFVAVLLAVAVIAKAQRPKKIPRIGYLVEGDPTTESTRSKGIQLALRELGYLEGQNIATEYRYAEGRSDRQPELAAELVRLKVDIIVTAGGGIIQAAKNATNTIPIVMAGSPNDPVEAGLVESLARPGGNVTGLTNLLIQLGDKRLELLKQAVPKVVRVAVLNVRGNRTHELELKEVQTAACTGIDYSVLGGTRHARFR